jgi:hypothetical protein
MRNGRRILAVMGVALCVCAPRAAHAQAADDEAAALQVVHDLFDGMREKDEAKLQAVWHAEARLQSAGQDRDGTPSLRTTPVEGFIASVVSSTADLDEVTFDEVVHIDGNLASVWAPYNLFVDDAFQHCGVDAIHLIRTSDGWKIFQLTDTRTQEGCDVERRGS